ncbi:MAG TPA: hypothetical protein VFA75_02900 [Nevskia sp.]|jgi:hypothetical protein|nr:hypothetical protein [Nevskia sp.]
MNHHDSGSTRPFGLLRRCARIGFAVLALLQPDLALAVSPMLGLLRTPA